MVLYKLFSKIDHEKFKMEVVSLIVFRLVRGKFKQLETLVVETVSTSIES